MSATQERHVRVFKNGRNRAVRIPVEFDFPGDEVIMRKEGDRIILEPLTDKTQNLVDWLRSQPPVEEDFPDFDLAEPPPRAVDL
ncbi:AbrB/MazE/SpoVT family DNA-binding domain-containing protein [Allorhizobium sp. BGMRC 0089]|uniref:antitoxin n=1 Tax=Allorhizobium sonneratiae TaxID=2934936 RepID=UPI0020341F27|nr:AbrB/MazE/SpoVT family DNA-binding domain-containing protein [Allorhizobium sonneratiae]MCM2292011.1 AbrB/MazE/SpoVT family DNA-binding domain-containing protein [Allorhizobium sonneratiae]